MIPPNSLGNNFREDQSTFGKDHDAPHMFMSSNLQPFRPFEPSSFPSMSIPSQPVIQVPPIKKVGFEFEGTNTIHRLT